ncbi:MAG: OprO/OprP family phosphate-selective porin [Fuerstiella sp.]|nr:OprO/OprP family phosphate-selective porin [Fuerstiella sp.]
MVLFRITGLICLAVLALMGGPAAFALDEPEQRLIQRLEAAEARIKELEKQLPIQEKSSDTSSEPFTSASWAPKPGTYVKDPSSDWLEKWEEQQEANDELTASIKKSVQSGTSATKSMKVVGRIHADYWGIPDSSPGINVIETGDPNNTPQDRAGFRRMRFGVRGDVSPNMGYRIEMEFAGGNDSEFRDAFISVKDASWLQTVIVGNHKRPYGLDHLNSSRHNVFLERPFVIESFNQDCRRLGVSSNAVSEDQAWNWRYGVWNQRLIQDEGNYISDHLQGEIAGRLANTYWYDESSGGRGYAHWAVSTTFAHPDGSTGGDPTDFGETESQNEARFRHRPEARTDQRWLDTGRIAGADWYEMIGLEKVINIGSLQIVGEYQNMFMQRDTGFSDLHLHGGYVYASYFLTGEHMPWNRKNGTLNRVKPFENFFLVDRCDGGSGTGWGAWQVAARYSYADFNDQNIFGGVGESLTLGLNWLWNANTRIQFNYINGTINDRAVGGQLTGGDYDIFGTRFMIDF